VAEAAESKRRGAESGMEKPVSAEAVLKRRSEMGLRVEPDWPGSAEPWLRG
jgi:hypothetical protein